MTDVTIADLSVGYGDHKVLDGVDLSIPTGSFVSVLGPSGCGKTTLLRSIAGLLPVTSGSIAIGEDVVSSAGVHVPPEKRGVGWVPQDASLFPHLTVRENIAFGIRKSPAARERVEELARLVGLSEHLDRAPSQLSGGQAQRVSLARALAPNPSIVLLDEPFAALDPMLRVALRREVADLLREQGATALLVTHDQDEALTLSDRIAVILMGRVLQWGTPHDVYERPATPMVARFVGQTVELPGEYADGFVTCALGRLPGEILDEGVRDGGQVLAILRPEWVELQPGGSGAQVVAVSYAGHHVLVTVRIADGSTLQIRVAAAEMPRVGAEVGLTATRQALVYR